MLFCPVYYEEHGVLLEQCDKPSLFQASHARVAGAGSSSRSSSQSRSAAPSHAHGAPAALPTHSQAINFSLVVEHKKLIGTLFRLDLSDRPPLNING